VGWAHRQGLSTGGYGLLLALNPGLVMALQLPATRLTSRWAPQPVIGATGVIMGGGGFALLAFAHTSLLLAAAVTAWSLGELVQWLVAAYTTSLAPPGMTARYADARSLCYGIALLLAPLAGTGPVPHQPRCLMGRVRGDRDHRRRRHRPAPVAHSPRHRTACGLRVRAGCGTARQHPHQRFPARGRIRLQAA
jgi:hypothetical protein